MKKSQVTADDINAASIPIKKGIERLNNLLGPNLPDELLAPVFDLTRKLGAIVEKVEVGIKSRVGSLVEVKGKAFTEAGSKNFDIAGWRLEIRPHGGGYDDDLLAALMKGKGIKRIKYKDVEKVYKTSKDKLNQLVGAKKVTQKELDRCKTEVKYSVIQPTQLKEVEDEA